MVAVDEYLYIERGTLFDLCGHTKLLNHDLRFITWIYWHGIDLYAEVLPTKCSVNSVSLCLNTICDQDDAFIRICGESPPCSLNRLRDVRCITSVFICLQPCLLDLSEFQFSVRIISIFQ